MKEKTVDIATFKKAMDDMVASNESSWNSGGRWQITTFQKDYSFEEVERILGSTDPVEIQRLSRYFYERNGLYKKLVLYYASLLTYSGLLIPNPKFGQKLSSSHIEKRYYAAVKYLDKANLVELMTRMSIRALIDGCYYGIIQTLNKEKLVIFDLPSGYARSRFRDIYGNDIVEFDVSYFDSIFDSAIKDTALKTYPSIVSSFYKKYSKGKTDTSWLILPADIGVCFSFFDDHRPLFVDIIPNTIQYDDAVDTERERELEEIRKIIVQKIPHLNDGQLLFEPDEAREMHRGAVNMMKKNPNLSILTTYADVDAIISKTSADNVSTSIEKMLQNVYSEAGVSAQIFAPTGSQALGTSIKNDISIMMILATKYARFITYITNFLFGNSNIDFKYLVLPVSLYTQSDIIKDALKLAQSGYSFLYVSAAMGINQQQLINLKALENDVLDLREKLIPLYSSYTESSNDVGAPEKPIEEKAEKTIQNEQSLDRQGGSDNE